MVFEKLVTLLAKHCDCDEAEITLETTFESLGIDSLDTVEILMDAEEVLGFEVELTERVATVAELVAFVEAKVVEQQEQAKNDPELAARLEEKLGIKLSEVDWEAFGNAGAADKPDEEDKTGAADKTGGEEA
ncbi:MAG: phosphopantetheine-binding protein [Gracilibacteraceae bacterium]|jgi:acyl carrier protein|nr:phosphopantetheine-binding protein [Gracilibacteraceae bacterium]